MGMDKFTINDGSEQEVVEEKVAEKNYYGQDFSYIHAKFGDLRKQYFFTTEFKEQHPTFVAEYIKYVNWDEKSKFEDPMQILNYVQKYDIPVEFYFNYTDTPAKNVQEVKDWLAKERLPQDYGTYENGKMSGWDGEPEVAKNEPKVRVIIGNQSRGFDDIMHLIKFVNHLSMSSVIKAEDIKLVREME